MRAIAWVIDENRLMGVNGYIRAQLEEMILRDRNHPSVILWSLGNEEWAIEGNIKGARIAATMQDFARRLDPTRLTTAAISGGWGGISTTIDVAGANYIKNANIDSQHIRYPRQVIVGTEETTTNATRGIYVDDRARAHLAPMEDGVTGAMSSLAGGTTPLAHMPPAVYWTGFDYRGEPTPFGYPPSARSSASSTSAAFLRTAFTI
jgi:beta-galactosidase